MHNASATRFEKVAAPAPEAGIGTALRQAFRMDGEVRSFDGFDELLLRLG